MAYPDDGIKGLKDFLMVLEALPNAAQLAVLSDLEAYIATRRVELAEESP